MIWTNPWAWMGLTAIAVPILIHLLTRETATPIPFPTLRFLKASAAVEARRRRLTHVPLLVVRCLIVALAVAALAQPFSTSDERRTDRIVIVDTSESVDTAGARAAVESHREGADAIEVIERADLRRAIREAAGWARARRASVSIVVISDFQRGALDAAALQALPDSAGVTLHRVGRRDRGLAPAGVARMTAGDARTAAAWAAPARADAGAIRIESTFAPEVNAAIASAARATAAAYAGEIRPVTFVLPDAPGRDAIAAQASPADEPWMFEVMQALSPGRARTVMTLGGRVIVFLATSDPAATTDAIREAIPRLVSGPPVSELEPIVTSDSELGALERQASARAGAGTPRTWVGRWFWMAALLLLGVEAVMRRTRGVANVEAARAA